jgi:hypothetical protein
VVVLDEDAAGQVQAVIGSSAAQHGILFQITKTRYGFARVEYVRVRAVNGIDKFPRQRGDAA